MQLIKQEDGRYRPAYSHDDDESAKVKVGGEVTAKRSRNPEHHRKGMAMLRIGFTNQDRYDSFEIYRQVITMKAGFFNVITNDKGESQALPHSLSFESMSQDAFEKWYEAVLTVISAEAKIDKARIESELINFM